MYRKTITDMAKKVYFIVYVSRLLAAFASGGEFTKPTYDRHTFWPSLYFRWQQACAAFEKRVHDTAFPWVGHHSRANVFAQSRETRVQIDWFEDCIFRVNGRFSEVQFHGNQCQSFILSDICQRPKDYPFSHGRNHSLNPTEGNYRANIRAMKKLGVTHILATTCCGSLKEDMKPGHFVVLDSFFDR